MTSSPEELQKKLYFLIDNLHKMHEELDPTFQMRIPYELLTSLANCLLNETIFQIVKNLWDIQSVTEKHLYHQRLMLQRKHLVEIKELQEKTESSPFIESKKLEHTQELKLLDMRLAQELDKKVMDQQDTLEKAGVPGFYITTNPLEIRVQMCLLDFMIRLSELS